MELAIGALELQNSLYFSLFAGNCVGDRFAGDCFHHHCLITHQPLWLSGYIARPIVAFYRWLIVPTLSDL